MNTRMISLICILVAAILAGACADPETAKQQAFESGNQYFDQKQYAEAIVEYRKAIQIDRWFGDARYKLAQAYELVGNVRGAYTEQIRAADLLPDNMEVQIKAGAYLLLTRQFEDAKSRVQRVLDRDPKNVQALVIVGNASAGLRDLDSAVADIEQAIEIDPSRSTSYTNLAALRLAQGQRDAARAAFEKAISVDPKICSADVAFAMSSGGTAIVQPPNSPSRRLSRSIQGTCSRIAPSRAIT